MATTTTEIDELDLFLQEHGIEHFSAREVLHVNGHGVQPPPPRKVWGNIIGACKLAELLREKMGHPLIIRHGYRPSEVNRLVGGKSKTGEKPGSQHLYFRAFDLQLPKDKDNPQNRHKFYLEATKMYVEVGKEHSMGLGLYREKGWNRLHIDTGHRQRIWLKEHYSEWLKAARHAIKHGDPDLATPQEHGLPDSEPDDFDDAPGLAVEAMMAACDDQVGIAMTLAFGVQIMMSRAHAATLRHSVVETANLCLEGLGVEAGTDKAGMMIRTAVISAILDPGGLDEAMEMFGMDKPMKDIFMRCLQESWDKFAKTGKTETMEEIQARVVAKSPDEEVPSG